MCVYVCNIIIYRRVTQTNIEDCNMLINIKLEKGISARFSEADASENLAEMPF